MTTLSRPRPSDQSDQELAPSSLRVETRTGDVRLIDELAGPWRNLCNLAADDEPFYRPEWIAAHIRAFTPRASIFLITVYHGAELCLVLPLLRARELISGIPVRTLSAPVSTHSCRFDAVRQAGPVGEAAVAAAWNFLKTSKGWDVLDLREVPNDGTLAALVALAESEGMQTGRVPMRPNPCVPIPAAAEISKCLPQNARLRGKLRQVRREIAAQGELRLRKITAAQREDLNRFYELEAGGWKGEARSAIAADPKTRQFYDEIATSAEWFGYLSMYFLELNGELLAAHLGLSYRDVYYSPKLAYDEKFKDYAPGHLIVSAILDDCGTRGVHTYDITGPDDEWKMRWTDSVRQRSRFLIFQNSIAGKLAHMMRFRVRPWAKRTMKLGSAKP